MKRFIIKGHKDENIPLSDSGIINVKDDGYGVIFSKGWVYITIWGFTVEDALESAQRVYDVVKNNWGKNLTTNELRKLKV